MSTPQVLLESVKEKIDSFQNKIHIRKGSNDYYQLAENFLIRILNPLFNCNLINANKYKLNISGIDLVDKNRKICFQVSAQNDLTKVKDSLEKTLRDHGNSFDYCYMLFLVPKQKNYSQQAIDDVIGGRLSFKVSEHILDLGDIARKVDYLTEHPQQLKDLDDHLSAVLGLPYGDGDTSLKSLNEFIYREFIDKNIIPSHFDDDFFIKYSDLLHQIIAVDGILSDNWTQERNVFEMCMEYICESESSNPLIIEGLSGSGKTTFLTLLYKYLADRLNSTQYLCLYINVQKYLKECNPQEANNKLEDDLVNIKQHIYPHVQIILILDGYDDSFRYIVNQAQQMIRTTVESIYAQKKVIGVNISDNVFALQRSGLFVAADADSKVGISNISVFDKEYEQFLLSYTRIKLGNKSLQEQNQLYEYLKTCIAKFKISRVDFFTLSLLTQKRTNIGYKDCDSLSRFYYLYSLESLEEHREEKLLTVSSQAFNFYIKKERAESPDAKGWELIHRHHSLRDYLIAYQIIYKLAKAAKNNTKKLIDDFVYTDIINAFCKEIMNADAQMQKNVYDGIIQMFKTSVLTARTHFSYLLGRFGLPSLKESATNFLQVHLDDLKKKDIRTLDKKELLYYRTIYISLIYLGKARASEEYINALITRKSWDSVNRGFHREYYGDILYDPGLNSLTIEDNVEEGFSNTYAKLYRKLSDCVDKGSRPYNLFDIELYTLCSLAQHRQVSKSGKIEQDQLLAIKKLIDRILDKRMVENNQLKKYIEFISVTFEKGRKMSPAAFLLEAYRLKEIDRAGWVARGIQPCEKVATHTMGAYMIGKICLPSKLPEVLEYDKTRILDMILIHDWGEAITGDILYDSKDQSDREQERNVIDRFSLFGTYFESEMIELGELWSEFEMDKQKNINAAIANDLDKLDNLLQLYIYKQSYTISDFEKWRDDLIDRIQTSEGHKIRDIIIDHFEEYEA